ncbi:MAG TPA: ABC transporter permease [Anaerolineaceae bacterium]|nr:ABC transporter permease [Anaerolineaceae bacterium]HPN51573.1 ABC transporter permease [Anaerolineaceae bacterium]
MSDEFEATIEAKSLLKQQNPAVEALRRLLRHRSAQLGLFIIFVLVVLAIFAEQIAPYDPIKPIKTAKRRDVPCIHLLGCPADQEEHIMGVDGNSRDLFSRIIYGSRLSLQIGLTTITFAILVGGLLGAVAGFVGGWLDDVIMRSLDVLMAFPSLLLAIAIVSIFGPGLRNALLAIAIVQIPVYARVVRAGVLSVRELDYVTASRSMGASELRVLFTRVLPNALTPLIVQGTLGIATAILSAAALSFLGLGAEFPTPEWGLMLGEERNSVFNAPHLVFFPGFAIMLTVLSFNLLGDGLRDTLDPRLRGL